MKTKLQALVAATVVIGWICPSLGAAKTAGPFLLPLAQERFTLVGARSLDSHEFSLETHVITLAPDGAGVVTDVYKLRLKCVPAPADGSKGDKLTCLDFTVQFGAAPEIAIPSLKGLTYELAMSSPNGQGGGAMLGIPHAPFENLADAKGQAIPPGNAYQIYDAFVDFHTFCDVFAHATLSGKGVQDLTALGQKIVHAAAFSEPAVDVGGVAKGSFFKNGEVTLGFTGLGVVDGATCAVLAVDSGRSSFEMTMHPAPTMEIKTKGGSHYKGDIYLNLATQWVSRVDASEVVVAETTLPMPPNKVNTVIERIISIRGVQ